MIDFSILFSTFLIVFIAELGDKTQLAVFALSATSRRPLQVFAASAGALVLSTVLASILGELISRFIPGFTVYIASGLFVLFGVLMLLSKETPIIGRCFAKLLSFEETIRMQLETLALPQSVRENLLAIIIEEEKEHITLLQFLLHKKKIFKDDINVDPHINTLCTELHSTRQSVDNLSFSEVLDSLIAMEKMEIEFFTFLLDHLQREEHEENALEKKLTKIISEEERHIIAYEKLKETGHG